MTPRTPATTPVTGTPDVAPAGVALAADQARLAPRRRRVRLTVVAAATLSMTLASCSSSDDGKPASSSGSSASSKASGSAGASAPADGNRTQADTGLPTQAELDAATGDVSKLTTKQRALLEEFRETETGEECPQSQGFFSRLKTAFAGE